MDTPNTTPEVTTPAPVDAAVLPSPVIQTPAERLAADIKRCEDRAMIHDRFDKHHVHVEQTLDADGNPEDNFSESAQYVDYDTGLCSGCGMPVDYDSDDKSKKARVTERSMESFCGSEAKYNNPAPYIVTMRRRLAEYKRKPSTRGGTNHLIVDQMMYDCRAHLDLAAIKEQILLSAKTAEKRDYHHSVPNWRRQIARMEIHLEGGITKPTADMLLQHAANKADNHYINRREESATMYMALAIKNKWPLDRHTISVLMKASKDMRMKQELTVYTGAFRMAAVKGTYLSECLPSYYYVRKHKPALLQDPKWVAKTFRFDKPCNRTVALRYYMDTGLGLGILMDHDDMMLGITKFLIGLHPKDTAQLTEYRDEKLRAKEEEWAYTYGTPADRRRLYQAADYAHLLGYCVNIEQYIKEFLDDDMQNNTDDVVADTLRLPTKEDVHTY